MVTNHVYAVAGAKGGVGKTTTSLNLGTSLTEAGYSTVTIELDLAMANVVDFLDLDIDPVESTTIHDVLAGDADVKAATYENGDGVAVVPSGTDLDDYAATDLARLPDVVAELRWHYDIVILDTPAGLSEETIRPIQVADEVLLVSTPRVASIRNVQNSMALADRVETDTRGLILTKSGTGASPGAEKIAEFLDVELLGHVPEDDAVPHSQDSGIPVVSNAPRSGAAVAYRKIASKLVHSSAPESDREKPSAETAAEATDDTETSLVDATGNTQEATDGGQEVTPKRVTKPHSPQPQTDAPEITKAPAIEHASPEEQYRPAAVESAVSSESNGPVDDHSEPERPTPADDPPEQDVDESTEPFRDVHDESDTPTDEGPASAETATAAQQTTTAAGQDNDEQERRSVTARLRSVIGF